MKLGVIKQLVLVLQQLQKDLHRFMRLEKQSAEYQLAVYEGGGSQYVKHRDALPDDGADHNQRRVSYRSIGLRHSANMAGMAEVACCTVMHVAEQ